MPEPTAAEAVERNELVNWFYGGLVSAQDSGAVLPDARLDTIKRLVPSFVLTDKTPGNRAALWSLLWGVPLDALRAERVRRNALHGESLDNWTDPALRQTGRREDVTTQDLVKGAFGAIFETLKPLLIPALVVVGILIATKGSK